MKKDFVKILLIFMMFIPACVNVRNTSSMKRIIVLSYNIHHGEGVDQQFDLERIAEVINSESPDVVSLQEVDNKTRRSKGIDQAKELARLTNMKYIYGSSMAYKGGEYGNAVLTTLTVKESKIILLPGEPRSALCVTLKAPGKESSAKDFIFVATHLDESKEPQFKSISLIENLFKSDANLPSILAGDLNAVPNSTTMQALEKSWQNATCKAGFTFPAKNPSKQIDYILCRPSGNWKVVETRVLDEAVASDHRPILTVLDFLPDYNKKHKIE